MFRLPVVDTSALALEYPGALAISAAVPTPAPLTVAFAATVLALADDPEREVKFYQHEVD